MNEFSDEGENQPTALEAFLRWMDLFEAKLSFSRTEGGVTKMLLQARGWNEQRVIEDDEANRRVAFVLEAMRKIDDRFGS